MENKNNTSSSLNLENLVEGESLLHRIRKVHAVAGDASKGFKPSIELCEIVVNPDRPATAVAEMNSDDDRFIKQKPQHAFQPIDLKVAIDAGWITKEQFDKLQPSKGVEGVDQKDGVHFINVNQLDPKFKGKRLRVQILEMTETNRKGVQVKINPKTDQPILVNGKPVYRIVQVAYEGNHKSRFLNSDNAEALVDSHKTVETMDISTQTKKSENLNP